MEKIEINPMTRLEGHAKVAVFLDEDGRVENTYFQVPTVRGFESFCEGRNAEEMPRTATSICGVCPVAHHMASAKALDDLYGVNPTPTAEKIRRLMYNSYIFEDHLLHFYYLGGPDFIVEPESEPSKRNVLGVIEETGIDIGKRVINNRSAAQSIVKSIGGDAIQPVNCTVGGVLEKLEPEERKEIKSKSESCLDFAKFTLDLFHDIVLGEEDYVDMINSDPYTLDTHYMGLVDEDNCVNLYDGEVSVVNTKGDQLEKFEGQSYLDHIGEKIDNTWTYLEFPFLKKRGWKGIESGEEGGIYRVGPLARLNASDGMSTPLAQKEYDRMYEALGGKPVHKTLAYHWARLIEMLFAAERMVELSEDENITGEDIRNVPSRAPKEGIGVVGAARGTLYHHYKTSENGVLEDVNLIVPTTHNHGGICMAIDKAARGAIDGGEISKRDLNKIEMAFRAHDPCMACATHSLPGKMPLEVVVFDSEGREIEKKSKEIQKTEVGS